jgi:F-type H+-transporting ATPase subunit delta
MADLATIARPYAEALASTASKDEIAKWSEHLDVLAQMAAHSELSSLANNPNVTQGQMADILLSGLKGDLPPAFKNFINLLTVNHRIAALPEIAKQFEEIKNSLEGSAEIMITSAFPMEDDEIKNLISSISKRFGNKSLKPTITVDPELIGGVKVQVGDEVLDSSVKSRLEAMRATLLS